VLYSAVYQTVASWEGVLRILTEMFLPHINLSELEQTFFSKVLPKAIQLFDDLLYELSSQAKGLTSQNIELCKAVRNVLQTMVQLLETLTGCVRHICTLQEPVPLESIRTLPSSILYVIKNTFMHCKDSESLYSECLHLISDLLQSLFKETYSLQKQLMELLDMISMESASAEDSIVDMVSVIHTVLEICSVISNMDHALHANTWKFIIKQSLKHHSLLQSHLKHKDILSGLCKDTLFSFHSCLQLAEQMKLSGTQETTDYKLFQRTVKLCRFFANSLVHYIKEFIPFLSDSCNLSPELHLPQCHLLVTIMDKLPSQSEAVQALWTTGSQFSAEVPRLSLFSALFLGFQQCSGELSLPVCLPGVMDNGQAEVPVTLYHHFCVHLCAFIASTPPSHFPQLERALLDAVLGSSMITSLLAMDSWCFLARYGTAELCAHHIFVIAHLVSSVAESICRFCNSSLPGSVLISLINIYFDLQVEFTQKFPPKEAENLLLWQHISLKALTPDLRKQVAHQLCAVGLTQCRQWLSGRCTLGELPPVNVALSVLLTVCNSAGDTLEAGLQAAALGAASQLWALLKGKQLNSFCLICFLFDGASSRSIFLQVFAMQTSLLELDPPDHVRLAALDLLSSMGKLFMPQEIQGQVIPKLSHLFASLLADKTWLIYQHALEAFTQFAETTKHEDVVPQCLNSEETKNKVVCFLAKRFNISRFNLQPLAKRACHSPCEEQYKSAIDTAERALEAVKLLLQKGPSPAWLAVKLEALQAAVAILRNTVR
uniref:Uncharacterized protein n=1 Tax=Terrapene triunguis TaxID=2587831 RepID=A0A674ISU6_9SAUR